MKVTIAIPSCSSERIPLLIQTVESIQAGSYKDVDVVIVADGNPQIYELIDKSIYEIANRKMLYNVSAIFNIERIDWNASINRVFKEFDSEYYIYASDDLIFPPDCIKHAMATMQRCFPDGFGVVTIGKKPKCAFGLLGRKFAEHFPDRQVMCPDFIHYGGDSELLRTIKELGVFTFPPERESQVKHSRLKDETWRLARRIRTRDRAIYFKRQEKGYKWGIDFNLIT